MFNKIRIFLQESRQELKRVNWPTRQETIRYTLFVIVISLILALFLGVFDMIFISLLEGLIGL